MAEERLAKHQVSGLRKRGRGGGDTAQRGHSWGGYESRDERQKRVSELSIILYCSKINVKRGE